MANNPKHGDEIIKTAVASFGGQKLIASSQFQEFLDNLGELLLNSETTGDDLDQQVIATLSGIESKLTSTASMIQILEDTAQETYNNQTMIGNMGTEIDRLNMIIEANSQSFAIMESNLATFVNRFNKITSKLDDLEQLEHVN